MSYSVRTTLILLAVVLFNRGVLADDANDDFVRGTAPWKYIERLAPERLPELSYPVYYNDLDKARQQAFHGHYRESLITLEKIHPRGKQDAVAVALIKSNSMRAVGELDDAIKTVSDAQIADDPAIQVRRAELLSAAGKTDEALALIRQHLKDHPDSIPGHFQLGQICEKVGDFKTARQAYDWFTQKPQDFLERWKNHERGGVFDSAELVTTIGRALDRQATLSEAYRNKPDLNKTILNIFVKAYDSIDREYWPAHVAAGEYFMSHDQAQDAAKELQTALEANPNDIHTLDLAGRMAVENFNFDGGDKMSDLIRQVNPDAFEADLLDARNLLRQRRPELAEAEVDKVLQSQPKNLEALGLKAAVYALQLKDATTAEILKKIEQIDPNNATGYFEVAEQLGAMRQYPRAANMYKKAIERAPWWTAARNGLGLLYTQSGDEDDARVTLAAAHELDPFNLATTNYLKLLDMMDGFARKESAHFIVLYDPKTDPVVPEYFSDYLESVHDVICKTFNYEPKVKTYIEVFPTHEAFSVRTTGSPWIGTVGASTGRVIALVAPRVGHQTLGPFNWAQVLRHEYTHTVTLGDTDNRIQHWMTEGLAVYEEQTPLRWDWVPMLYGAVTHHQLFPIDQLTWSFVRPKRPIDRQLAYAESFWICKYIEEKYGHETILKMLTDCRNAEPQEVFFPKETHRSLTDFQNDFFAWCDAQVATWGYDQETTKKYEGLREKGESLIKARQYDDAIGVWEQIEKLRPVDALPHSRLAGLYLALHQNDKAIGELDHLAQVELKDNRYTVRIARIYRDDGKLDEAAKYAMKGVYIDPYDPRAHELLAEIYSKTGNEKGLTREKRVLDELARLSAQKKSDESQN